MNARIPTQSRSPHVTNAERHISRRLDRMCNQIHITNVNGRIARKRKKYIHNTERAAYRELIIAVAEDLKAQRRKRTA